MLVSLHTTVVWTEKQNLPCGTVLVVVSVQLVDVGDGWESGGVLGRVGLSWGVMGRVGECWGLTVFIVSF